MEDKAGSGSQKPNAVRDQQRGQFRIAYGRAVETYTQMHGKAPTTEAADAIMRATQKQFAEQVASGTTGIYTQAAQFRATISEADRRRVRDAWTQKYGRTPTDAEVTIYFARKAKGSTAK